MLKENLESVERKIEEACRRAGRMKGEVTLVAVSKTKPVSMLQEVYDLGIRVFGENKVQEIRDKYEALPADIEWHMIAYTVQIAPEFDGFHAQSGMLLVENGDLRAHYAVPSAFSAYTKYLW